MTEIVFKPHSTKQSDVVFSDSKITVLSTGIQFGKTLAGAHWLLRKIWEYPTANFIIAAPTYKILEQSTLPHFLKVMEGEGKYNHSSAVFNLHAGGVVYCRTNTDPDSVIGITDVRGIWGDEAGKFTLYFWQNLQARAGVRHCPILLTTTPYTLNWIYKELVKPKQTRKDALLVHATSIENPYFNRDAWEHARLHMDARRFQMLYGGEWGRMQGLVYDCWDDQENLVDPFQLPTGTRYVGGVDWGFTDPFAMTVRAITSEGKHYGVSEFYKVGMTISDMIQVAKQKKQIYNIEIFYADPSQPGSIEEFNRSGLPTVGANNDIRRGIDLHYELIKTRQYKEFRGACPHSQDERDSYHYPELVDLKPDQDSKDQIPVGQSNHLQDCMRYVTIMTYRYEKKLTPKVPEVKSQKVNIFKPSGNKQYESWN